VKEAGWAWVQNTNGDPLYMPPEVLRSTKSASFTREADIFALGRVLCELYTNSPIRDVFLSDPHFKDETNNNPSQCEPFFPSLEIGIHVAERGLKQLPSPAAVCVR